MKEKEDTKEGRNTRTQHKNSAHMHACNNENTCEKGPFSLVFLEPMLCTWRVLRRSRLFCCTWVRVRVRARARGRGRGKGWVGVGLGLGLEVEQNSGNKLFLSVSVKLHHHHTHLSAPLSSRPNSILIINSEVCGHDPAVHASLL